MGHRGIKSVILFVFFCLLLLDESTEQIQQNVSPMVINIEIYEAKEKGLIEVNIYGAGLEFIKLVLQSLSSTQLEVTILPGTIFKAQSAGTQNMVVTEERIVRLEPNKIVELLLHVACETMWGGTPGARDEFTIEKVSPSGDLIKLVNLPDFQSAPFDVQQFAVWTITDNPARDEYRSIGYFGFYSGPADYQLFQILALFEKAGISTRKYKALRDLRIRKFCKGYDLWSQDCVGIRCADAHLIEPNSVQCGFDPCQGHCANKKKDCGEHGVDCGGGCPVVDIDRDGVEDCEDLCPDSRCSVVDPNGCETDIDKDGVVDCEDDCPDKRGDISKKGCPDVTPMYFILGLIFLLILLISLVHRKRKRSLNNWAHFGLVKALENDNNWVRVDAVRSLGRMGPEAKNAIPFLIKALNDKDWLVRNEAAWALGRMGPDAEKAIPFLIKALIDRNPQVINTVSETLGTITRQDSSTNINYWQQWLKKQR